MQKVINVLAILSFLGTTTLIATSGYVYWRRDYIVERATKNITEAAKKRLQTCFLLCWTQQCLNFLTPLAV